MLPTDNPFAAPSELPLHFPPFDRIREEHYRPAIEEGMAEQLAEVAAIGAGTEPPTFAKTLEPLERSGGCWTACCRCLQPRLLRLDGVPARPRG